MVLSVLPPPPCAYPLMKLKYCVKNISQRTLYRVVHLLNMFYSFQWNYQRQNFLLNPCTVVKTKMFTDQKRKEIKQFVFFNIATYIQKYRVTKRRSKRYLHDDRMNRFELNRILRG